MERVNSYCHIHSGVSVYCINKSSQWQIRESTTLNLLLLHKKGTKGSKQGDIYKINCRSFQMHLFSSLNNLKKTSQDIDTNNLKQEKIKIPFSYLKELLEEIIKQRCVRTP